MANKKITVVGDGAEEPLTPEEAHDIEVKVDRMLGPDAPKQSDAAAKAEPSGPKVTKIVTKFADEPEPEESPVEEKPKPTPKKITVRHHDEDAEEAAEAEPKPPKAKPAAKPKKPAKKLKVTVSDGSAPEDLAAAITTSAQAAEEMISAKPTDETAATEPTSVTDDEPKQEEIESFVEPTPEGVADTEPTAPEESPEPSEPSTGAPPLILKHKAVPIDAPQETESTQPDTEVAEPDESQPPKTEIAVAEPEEEAEEVPVEIESEVLGEPEAAAETAAPVATEEPEAAADDAKKYRPPEGPIQFKRAEVPIEPRKPGEPRPEESSSELSEDEALAQAFEAPKTATAKSKSTKGLARGLLKLLKWLIILAIVAGIVAVSAVPSLRHKVLNAVGLDKTTTTSSSNSAPKPTATPASSAQLSPDVYISKRAGVYNIYKATVSGQQEQLVLAGTGTETDSLALAPNTAGTYAALVSTRDGKRNAAGALQQTLTLVSITDGKPTALDNADQIKLIDWYGSRIVYVLLNTSTSTNDPSRYQIVTYDTASQTRTVIDHMNYLNDVLSAKGSVYYATATGVSGNAQFVKVLPDGTSKMVVLSSEVAAITRTSYDAVVLSTVNKWYNYVLGAPQATATNNTGQSSSRLYIDSPDGKHSAYLTANQLTVLDVATSKETNIPVTNATYPLRWLSNDTLLYRSNSSDYQVRSAGGTPAKVTAVEDVPGISLWHDK